jgi:hypothetical protein
MTYNRPGGGPSGGGGNTYDYDGPSSGAGYWPDGTPKSQTSRGDRPDPRYPQKDPSVPVPGKNFFPRQGWVTSAPRGGPEIRIGPGSSEWSAGADDVLNKRSLTTSDVNRTRRRPK